MVASFSTRFLRRMGPLSQTPSRTFYPFSFPYSLGLLPWPWLRASSARFMRLLGLLSRSRSRRTYSARFSCPPGSFNPATPICPVPAPDGGSLSSFSPSRNNKDTLPAQPCRNAVVVSRSQPAALGRERKWMFVDGFRQQSTEQAHKLARSFRFERHVKC